MNLAFHDLTPDKSEPQAAREVLVGLNLKFIETPLFTTGGQTIYDAFEHFDRDVFLKTFFAGQPEDITRAYHPKMYNVRKINLDATAEVYPIHREETY